MAFSEDAQSVWQQYRPSLSNADWQTRKQGVQELARWQHPESLLPFLLEAVRDRHDTVLRNSALEVLSTLGTRIVPLLIAQLDSSDLETQKFLIDVLGNVGSPFAAPRLATLLSHYDKNIRFAAAEALGRIAVPLSAEALLGQISANIDGTERFILLQSLTNTLRTGVPTDLSIATLRPLRTDPLLTRALLELLRVIDSDEAYTFLWEWLEEFDELRLQEAVRFLGKLPPDRLATLTLGMGVPRIQVGANVLTQGFARSLDDDVRNGSYWFACWCGNYDYLFSAFHRGVGNLKHLVAALSTIPESNLDVLFQSDPSTLDTERQRVIVELIGRKNISSRAPILQKIARRSPELRPVVFRWSCELRQLDVLPWLQDLLRIPDAIDDVAAGLQALLPEFRQEVLDVLSPWSDAISDSSDWQTFLILVERLNLVSVRNRVEAAWKRSDPAVRAAALPILARFKLDFARHYLSLALVDDDVGVRLAAAEILSDVVGEGDFRELRTLLVDRDAWIRAIGVKTLARLLGAKAEAELAAKLQDRSDVVRIEALRALANLRLDKHAGSIRALLDREQDADAVCECIRYLRMTNCEPNIRDTIWLNHRHWRIRLESQLWFSGYERFRDELQRAQAAETDTDVRTLSGARHL